jgi:hypothetical protein
MVGRMRRCLLALGVSLAVHVTVAATVVGISAWRTFSSTPRIQVHAIAIDLVKDLPLGPPPAKEVEKTSRPAARVRVRRAVKARDGVVVSAAPDAGVVAIKPDATLAHGFPDGGSVVDGGGRIDGGRRRPGDLRQGGPEGSRVVALLRLDRLRASPDGENTSAAADRLLMLLPDRRRLIEGTGFDLFRDFDNLLIATPNPRDPAVTFLAARHHLGEVALKAGLERGAKATGRPIRWRTVDGRPVGLRQQGKNADANLPGLYRDDRILVLPETNLAIVATPAYAAQLLGMEPSAGSTGKPAPIDGGAAGSGPAVPSTTHVRWRDIVARIDAEDAALPDDAAFMMTAINLFGPAPASPGVVVPPTRGAAEDTPPQVVPDTRRIPEAVTLVAGIEPPYLQIVAELATAADAEGFEQELPAWRQRLLTNPVVLLGGFSPLIRRTEISRDGSTVDLRVDATVDEILRLLNLVANLARSALGAPR